MSKWLVYLVGSLVLHLKTLLLLMGETIRRAKVTNFSFFDENFAQRRFRPTKFRPIRYTKTIEFSNARKWWTPDTCKSCSVDTERRKTWCVDVRRHYEHRPQTPKISYGRWTPYDHTPRTTNLFPSPRHPCYTLFHCT